MYHGIREVFTNFGYLVLTDDNLDLVDDTGDYFASRSLDVFMSKIRKYLEDEPCVEIKTVRGVGFMMLLDCI